MRKILGSLCIISLVLYSCINVQKDEADDSYNIKYIVDMNAKSIFYSSGFEEEGNDYYYINVSESKIEDEYDHIYRIPSVPSKYILDVDAKWQRLDRTNIEEVRENGIKKDISSPNVDKFILRLYDIRTKEVVKTIDVKKVIEESKEDVYIAMYNFNTMAIKGEPYILITVANTLHSITDDKPADYRWFCVNLFTGDYLIKNMPPQEFVNARYSEVAIFNERFEFWALNAPGIKYQGRLFVYNMDYWEGCRDISMYLDEIPVNNEKLYSKFPTLKTDVEKLKEDGKDALIHIILTDNPSYEEIASYMAEGDYQPTFNTMTVFGNESRDGEKHIVESAEEWYKYYKYYRPENMYPEWISPIFPREN